MVSDFEHVRFQLDVLAEQALFSLRFGVAHEQHREVAVIESQHDRVCIDLVAAGFHLLFSEEWFAGGNHRQNGAAAEIVLLSRLRLFILRAALFHRRLVFIEKGGHRAFLWRRRCGRSFCLRTFALRVRRSFRRRRGKIDAVIDYCPNFDSVQNFIRAADVI